MKESKLDDYCHYSDLPSPKAYMNLDFDDDDFDDDFIDDDDDSDTFFDDDDY